MKRCGGMMLTTQRLPNDLISRYLITSDHSASSGVYCVDSYEVAPV